LWADFNIFHFSPSTSDLANSDSLVKVDDGQETQHLSGYSRRSLQLFWVHVKFTGGEDFRAQYLPL
jgi:hypothetical protein